VTALLVGVIGILVLPLFRDTEIVLIEGQAAAIDEEQVNIEIERQTIAASLSELEVDFSQGKVSISDYEVLKLKFEHRLLDILDKLELFKKGVSQGIKRKKSKLQPRGKKWLSMALLALLVGGGSIGTYQLVQWKLERQTFASESGAMPSGPAIDPKVMVARLEKKLKENPDDLQGQLMIGRSYMAMERWDDARKAWKKVLELDPKNYSAHYRLGEVILNDPKTGTMEEAEEALMHFDKALISVPQDASILWARGIVLLQMGRTFEADEAWTEAFQYIPRGTPSSEMVKKALEDLRAGRTPGAE